MFSLIIFTALLLKTVRINEENYNKLFLSISFILLFIVSALRAELIGTDTVNYINTFNLIKVTDFSQMFDSFRYENGYIVLNKIVSYISSNPQSIIIVTSFIVLYLILNGIKNTSENKVFSVVLFITLYYYFVSFNAIRQYIAIGLLIVAYNYIKKRKLFKFIIFVLIATAFHQLALIFLPLYLFYGIKLNYKKLLFIATSFVIFLVGFDTILDFVFSVLPEYSYYQGTEYFEGGGVLTSLVSGSILLFGLLMRGTTKTDKEFDFLLLIVLFSFLTSLMSTRVILFNRLNYYFEIFNIFFIPKAVNMEKNPKLRLIYYIVISSITIFYCVIRLIEGWHRVIPYKFFVQ